MIREKEHMVKEGKPYKTINPTLNNVFAVVGYIFYRLSSVCFSRSYDYVFFSFFFLSFFVFLMLKDLVVFDAFVTLALASGFYFISFYFLNLKPYYYVEYKRKNVLAK